eukprot:TRINITY_DN10604_c0_g1_i14.p1 TRINITY_DN10604_c0_g1~~TRINITY_DN10604_c0_g1_i14.p1  ORF type:complete len:100 (-),score=15.77 TRINITY_DN10604_c0_g1_i14:132-431(-)
MCIRDRVSTQSTWVAQQLKELYVDDRNLYKEIDTIPDFRLDEDSLDSSEDQDDIQGWQAINCTMKTVETVCMQVAALPLPEFFYTRMLPLPSSFQQSAK